MRKVLLGTTALVAAGLLVATTAQAQDEEEMMAEEEMMVEPITASVSGYYHVAFISYSADEDTGDRGHGIDQNMEIQVGGSTTLDNGITVSASMDIRPGNADDSSVSLSGGFGTISYGNIASAARGTPGAPWGNALFNVNGAWFGPKGIDTGGNPSVDNDKSVGVKYTSPSFNGFTLGVSYAPDSNNGGFYNGRSNAEAGKHSEQVGVGLSFSQSVLGGSFAAGVTHESHTTEAAAGEPCDVANDQCDPEVLRYGASISIDDITIGAGGLTADVAAGAELEIFNAGISYSLGGGTSVGIGIANSSNAGDDSDIISLDVGYNLGPGVDLAASVQSGSDDADNNDWTAVLVGTAITF
jgi:predicted porin